MTTPRVEIVVAVGRNLEIGNKGDMPWPKMKADLAAFKSITMGAALVMGRRTFESFGSKPLPGRTNIVLTRKPFQLSEECFSLPTFPEAYLWALHNNKERLCAIGGAEVYQEALRSAQIAHVTLIDSNFAADTFFPPFDRYALYDDKKHWVVRKCEPHEPDDKNPLPYTFMELERVLKK